MNTYEKRHTPARFGGIPLPLVFQFPVFLIFFVFIFAIPLIPLKLVFFVVAGGVGYLMYDVIRYYENWNIKEVLAQGEQMKKWPTFGAKKVHGDVFCWKTFVGDHGIMLRDGSVAIAFRWDGVKNRYFSESEAEAEHARRVGLLKGLPVIDGLCVEHHFFRNHDDTLVDAYLAEGEAMHGGEMPAIVRDIRQQAAAMYRPVARSNRVVTVFSLGLPMRRGFWSFLMPSMKKQKTAEGAYATLIDTFKKVQFDYPGASLLSYEDFMVMVDETLTCHQEKTPIDWRFDLCDQLIVERPVIKNDCVFYRGKYHKVMLLQNYPALSAAFAFKFSEIWQDAHVAQVMFPVAAHKVLDKSADDQDLAEAFTAKNKGVDIAQSRIGHMAAYRHYVAQRGAPVFDNCYVITLTGDDPEKVGEIANALQSEFLQSDGLIRSDEDVQREMFRARLPGLGRTTLFARNDHIDTIACMMPFTVYSAGTTERPESLRVDASGQLVGFAPSRQAVAHELVVAETYGGKDTQKGFTVLETYRRIRWDIIEFGNSYQGVIEAIGGRYCRAKEEVINPLVGYDDYAKAVDLENASGGKYRIVSPMIASQSIAILPLLKGLKATEYDVAETLVVERAIRYCYENPHAGAAPTMPILAKAFDAIQTENARQESARDALAERLTEWLKTETGSAFTQEDQFVISPIANAIDFAGVEGDLLKYYMLFICARLANNAFARGARSQIVLNEYKVLLTKAPEPIHWITVMIDRMGRKEWVGLSRITQGMAEICSVDSEAINSIPNRTLLSRKDQHTEIGELLQMPPAMVGAWRDFGDPKTMEKKGYREGIVSEGDDWHHLILRFPQLLLDLMNTSGDDKPLREKAYLATNDPYERIAILKKLQAERKLKEGARVNEPII